MADSSLKEPKLKQRPDGAQSKKSKRVCPLSLQQALELSSPEAQVVELSALFEALLRHLTDGRVPLLSQGDFPKRLDFAVKQGWLKRPALFYKSNDTRNAIVHRAINKPFPSVARVASARDIFRNGICKLAAMCKLKIRRRVLGDELPRQS
jgi:hypothetical protein